jgi:hypothetical protein
MTAIETVGPSPSAIPSLRATATIVLSRAFNTQLAFRLVDQAPAQPKPGGAIEEAPAAFPVTLPRTALYTTSARGRPLSTLLGHSAFALEMALLVEGFG